MRAFWVLCASSVLAACGSMPHDDSNFTEAVLVESLADESSLVQSNVWHEAKQRGVTFRAIGQEPGWLLEISRGKSILLKTHYGQTEKQYPYVAPVIDTPAGVRRFRLDQITIVIRERACTDVMSGEQFLFSVKLLFNDRYLAGCGRNLDSIEGMPDIVKGP